MFNHSQHCANGNQPKENLSGVAIRCGQDRPDEYGKTDGQDVKRGVITTRLSFGRRDNPVLCKHETGEYNAKA